VKLYQVNQNGNKFCGPAVLSALAGIGTKEAAAIIRSLTQKTFVKSTTARDVKRALVLLGFGMANIDYQQSARVTLRQWATTHARGKDVYLVAAGRHWILLQGRNALCGKTINLVATAEHPNARAFVTEAHKITRVAKINSASVLPKKLPSISHAKTNRLAKAYGIEIEKNIYYKDFMVYPPPSITEDEDPHEGDHYCSDWSAVTIMVAEYARIICQRPRPILL
jgi:hypothetical protein